MTTTNGEVTLPTNYQSFIHMSRYSRWLEEEGRREGIAEGKIEGGNEAEARLSAQVSALEKLITNTINSETLDAGYLRNLLGQKIAEIASERAGSEIAIAPEGFSEKIEKLLDTVSHATETPLIFLNGTDYQSVALTH